MARRMDSYRGEFVLDHPTFKKGSMAVAQEAGGPVSVDSPDIEYSLEDDEAIDDFHRKTSKAFI